ncbi:IS21-like element helper ATPase IstB [Arenibacter sp. S6351L]|jgi:DNA replication protein DnaC|uniref:IS21-like element helper ATPase IstB n=1 Tax=Arenibacter sp. S6351L TaxID=2926407 RepID=UPI001FF413C2|nr:IS21-like element helper ATPase IstB [Arenibacter sp. S6351L]MCK0137404.1 IS21-like element helper ATPase IstB [Arenibacter sp. S6351L]|tara:strand:- start:189 stop:923 length:735 start_codon:yes stop_codon:yes gene_type:complete
MNQTTLSKMKTLGLHGMYEVFKTTIESGKSDHYTIDQLMAQLIETEYDYRQNRKIERSVQSAQFRYRAALEDVIFDASRNLDRTKLLRLAQGDYISNGQDVLITGSTGAGKSYLATALGYQACIDGYRVKYYNTNRLMAKLKMAKADGFYLKELAKLERLQLIILDDFGLQPMDQQSRIALLEIIEDRHGKNSVIITSQLPVSRWYDIIGEKTIADATMDRLVHHAHRFELQGESMRKKKSRVE